MINKTKKNKIIKIADDLKADYITLDQAQEGLLNLFGVDVMLCRFKNHAEIHGYPSKSFKRRFKRFIRNYC